MRLQRITFLSAAIGLTVCSLWAGAQVVPCYFLQRSGCTTGGFCQVGQTVCDVGYSSGTGSDTGCGNQGPLQNGFTRKCYKIEGQTLTVDCASEVPAGGWVQIGCSSNGVCCYASSLKEQEGDHGTMAKPTGNPCGCG